MIQALTRIHCKLKNGPENIVSINRTGLSQTVGPHWYEHPAKRKEDSKKKKPRSEKDLYKSQDGTNNIYVVDITVRHIG